MIDCYKLNVKQKNFLPTFNLITTRFNKIIEELKLKICFKREYRKIIKNILKGASYDYVISRGEYLNAKIMAKYLQFKFIDARKLIIFNDYKKVNIKKSHDKIIKILKSNKKYVVPGFYGKNSTNNIVTFSRGGSDITGAILAAELKADLYENWTDVNGFMTADPKQDPKAKSYIKMAFDKANKLSVGGAKVIHYECFDYLKNKNVNIIIKNTFNTKFKGSLIINEHGAKYL